MLECEGYKMFEGCALIEPKSKCVTPFWLEGVWLYKPDTNCWYCKGRSFPANIVKIPGEKEGRK